MVMAKKQIVQRYDRSVGIYQFDAPIIDVVELLNDKMDAYGAEATMEVEYGYDGDCAVIISYKEEETDKELERRLARGRKKREKNKADKGRKEVKERKDLERLKKKYES